MSNTYWVEHPRGFANEWTLCRAASAEEARACDEAGFSRISRREALEYARATDNAATQQFSGFHLGSPDSAQVLGAEWIKAVVGR